MIDIFHSIILAIIQGVTEFLPISSSAHLILFPKFFNWTDQGLAFDVAVHVGTLLAVVVYFRKEIKVLAKAWLLSLVGKGKTVQSNLAWAICLGTIPVGLAGIYFKEIIENSFRSMFIIALTSIVFGIFLGFSSKFSKEKRSEYNLGIKDIIVIGGAQVLALIPGASRSGVTVTAGLMMGLTKEAAARYSFLLSIPVILCAGGLETFELIKMEQAINLSQMIVPIFFSFITAFMCIKLFLYSLSKVGLAPFVVYRILLGVFLLVVL